MKVRRLLDGRLVFFLAWMMSATAAWSQSNVMTLLPDFEPEGAKATFVDSPSGPLAAPRSSATVLRQSPPLRQANLRPDASPVRPSNRVLTSLLPDSVPASATSDTSAPRLLPKRLSNGQPARALLRLLPESKHGTPATATDRPRPKTALSTGQANSGSAQRRVFSLLSNEDHPVALATHIESKPLRDPSNLGTPKLLRTDAEKAEEQLTLDNDAESSTVVNPSVKFALRPLESWKTDPDSNAYKRFVARARRLGQIAGEEAEEEWEPLDLDLAKDLNAGQERLGRGYEEDWDRNSHGGGRDGHTSEPSNWLVDVELLWLDYNREDGVRVGAGGGEVVDWNMEFSPRVSIAYQMGDSGFRARGWLYDHDTQPIDNDPLSQFNVEAYNIDAEWFTIFQNCSPWLAELSLGVRYNSFSEEILDSDAGAPPDMRLHSFHGFGPETGLEIRRWVMIGTSLYARTRGAILFDSALRVNAANGAAPIIDRQSRSARAMIEASVGVEQCFSINRTVVKTGIGFEYQRWSNYTSRFLQDGNEDIWNDRSYVEFVGLTARLGVEF